MDWWPDLLVGSRVGGRTYMVTRLEYRDEKSQKFWEIETEGDSHTVRYGRIGSNGQTKTKSFADAGAAEADAEKMIAKKRKKGYVDADGATAPAKKAATKKAATKKAAAEKAAAEKAATKKAAPKKAAPKKPENVLDRYKDRIAAVEREIKDSIYKDQDEERLETTMAYIRGTDDELPSFREEYKWDSLPKIFAPLTEWTEVDERVLDVLFTNWTRNHKNRERGFYDCFYDWLAPQIGTEGDRAIWPLACEYLKARGADDAMLLRHGVEEMAAQFETEQGTLTSLGRYVLDHYPAEADALLKMGVGKTYGTRMCTLFARNKREDFDKQLPEWWKKEKEWGAMQLARALMKVDADRYAGDAEACLGRLKEYWPRFQVVDALVAHDEKHLPTARTIVEEALKEIQTLRNGKERYSDAAWDSSTKRFKQKTPILLQFLLGHFGHDAKEVVFDYIENTKELSLDHVAIAVRHLGQDALKIAAEGFGVPIDGADSVSYLTKLLGILNQLDWSEYHDKGWALVEHSSKPVRVCAARGIAEIGESVVPRAIELTKAKKGDLRHGGAMVLGHVGNDTAIEALSELVATEKSDDVRDPALEALDRAMGAAGQSVDDAMRMQRFERAKQTKKLDKPPLKWLKDESKLPKLKWKSGKALSTEWVRYLLYRQARRTDAEVDIELAPVLAEIDLSSSADFAEALWEGFLKSKASAKDKLCIVLAAALGGERLAPGLATQASIWAASGRGALAEICVHALSRIDADIALRCIDALRRAGKGVASNVVQAAEDAFNTAADLAGVSPEELADRVVPDLGFAPDGTRALQIGDDAYKLRIGADFKLRYESPAGKITKSPPKGVSKEQKSELKELAKDIKTVAKEQKKRIEAAMVLGRRWTPKQFTELMLNKAVRHPYALSTVWGIYDGANLKQSFRPLGDGSFSSVDNDEVELKGSIGIVHAADLKPGERAAWVEHLIDHEVAPQFKQLDRTVIYCPQEEHERSISDRYDGETVEAGTFFGRAGGAGWRRGSVVDGGAISAFHRSFGPAGVDVILMVEGLSINGDHYGEARAGRLMFVKDGSVEYGSYTYGEPRNEDDDRLIALGEVPIVVYSEAMADLARIFPSEE